MWLSGYRAMWILICFDLPTDTPIARYQYTQFRKYLIEDGFKMMQYSIYFRHSASRENINVHLFRVRKWIPPDGEVRILLFTDKQFERMEVYQGKRRLATEKPPNQLEMF